MFVFKKKRERKKEISMHQKQKLKAENATE
jgi:hypothetical protein